MMRSLRVLAVAAVVLAPATHARQSNEFQPVTTQMLVKPGSRGLAELTGEGLTTGGLTMAAS